MEHRLNRRIILATPVFVFRQEHPQVIASTRDFCATGAFLQTAAAASFHLNEYLELVMPLLRVQGRVPALVVHVADDGLGVMLDPGSAELRASLKRAALPKVAELRIVA